MTDKIEPGAFDANPDALERWPSAYLLSQLLSVKTELHEYIADGAYEWSRQAVLRVRDAYARRETLCAFGAKWCRPGDPFYERFNERWKLNPRLP